MKRTTRLTPACCLRQQGFRDALQRLSMTLMLVMLTTVTAWAQSQSNLGNCWHVPEATQPTGTYMRNPIHPYASLDVSIYTGNLARGDEGENPGDQSGGTIYYRAEGAPAWQTEPMEYNTEIGNNKYWRGTIPANEFVAVEYVIKVTYNDAHDDTYLGLAAAGDVTSTAFGTLEAAAAHPFSFTYVTTENVSYIDESGTEQTVEAIPLDDTMTTLDAGWYVVNSNITVDSRIDLTGDTNLILGDGYTLDVEGIFIPQGSTLTIYAQSDGVNAGKIVSHPSDGAAIGGKAESDNGNIVIYGGIIEATGAANCAGIGSYDGRTGGTITIYGGTVTAKGGTDAAAIGGGRNCSGGTIDIYGGTITANGPTDWETSENGAGIGGGDNGSGGTITINGGTITSNKVNQGQGARIGGGCDAAPGTIIINGGTITTVGGSGAGIGGGKGNLAGGTVTINGGIISASISTSDETDYAISCGQDVVINGGTVTATGLNNTNAIWGKNISINGGTVIANGTIGTWSSGTVTIAEGMIDVTLNGGTKRVITDDITDDVSNALKNQEISISYSRTYTTGSGTGKASTLCLPFDFVADDADGTYATFTNVTETAGVYEVTMTQVAAGTTLTAGTPYMFVPQASGKLTQGNTAYTVPIEGFVSAGTENNGSWQFKGTFETKTWPSGQTHLYGFAGKDYYLGSGEQIAADDIGSFRRFSYGTCAAFRCYLLAPGASAARGVSEANSLPETLKVRLVKTDGTTTAIGTMDMRTGEVEFGDAWYDLNGRRLDSQPTQHGVYIYKGKRVIK